ncbi:hypothetical protein HK097_009438 [Rhizophlyctis rosea]|uniref:Uncharacterized protein n=1 Tax=Rhizophlyctis rosea TaxID=64517 RepID=A0AAD5X4K6_9FUNG|nr:hypothetical protein HK097_009438 [Rhizophlyctis rosea]
MILLLFLTALGASYVRRRRYLKRHSQTFGAIFPTDERDDNEGWLVWLATRKRQGRNLEPPPSLSNRNSFTDSRLSLGMMEGGVGSHGHGHLGGVLGGTLGRRPSSSYSGTLVRNGSVVSFASRQGTLSRGVVTPAGVMVLPMDTVLEEDLRDVGLSNAFGSHTDLYNLGTYGSWEDNTIPLGEIGKEVPVCVGSPTIPTSNMAETNNTPLLNLTPPTPISLSRSPTLQPGPYLTIPQQQPHSPSLTASPHMMHQSPLQHVGYLSPLPPAHSPVPQQAGYHQGYGYGYPYGSYGENGMMSLPRAVSPLEWYGLEGGAYGHGMVEREGESAVPGSVLGGVVGNAGGKSGMRDDV